MSRYTIVRDLHSLTTTELIQIFMDEISARIVNDKAELSMLEPLAEELQKCMEDSENADR